MNNPINTFNQEYDQIVTRIAARLDNFDVILDKRIGLNITEILMICLILLSLIWTFK